MADIDRCFARLLSDPAAGLAVAVTRTMHRGGHACLPLAQCTGRPVVDILEWPPVADENSSSISGRPPRLTTRSWMPPVCSLLTTTLAADPSDDHLR